MLEQYEFEGEIFNVHPSQKEDFLKKYPNAQPKQSEPDFQTPTAPDAVVEENTASNMDSSSDPGSLDLQIDPNKFKVFDPKSINKPTGMGFEEGPVVDNSKTQSNINKISENLKQKEVKEKTKKRASYRSGVSAIINSNTPYQLGLEGESIEELNSKGLDSKIRELAKNAFYANINK